MSTIPTIAELEKKPIKSSIITTKSGCYWCIHFDKIEKPPIVGAHLFFKDGTKIRLCGLHFARFKQNRE